MFSFKILCCKRRNKVWFWHNFHFPNSMQLTLHITMVRYSRFSMDHIDAG